MTKVGDTEIEGWAQSHCSYTGYAGEIDYRLHFVIQFDQKIEQIDAWVQDRVRENIKTGIIKKEFIKML